MRSRTRAGLAGALVIGGLVLAGCGGDDDGGGSGGDGGAAADVVVHGTDALKFDKTSYSASAGDVTVELTNDGNTPHTLLIEGNSDFKLEAASKGKSDEGTVAMAAGTYTIYCDVPGHRQAGMESTLVVN
jgi:plastocyanin